MLLKNAFIALFSFSILHADTLKECKTEADKISGCMQTYYDNGAVFKVPYKNDKREGMVKWYYESGNLASEIPHKNDEAYGNLKYYTEDGELLALLKAENGKITSGKCYNNKAPTNKDLEEIGRFYNAGKAINYLKEICLSNDSK